MGVEVRAPQRVRSWLGFVLTAAILLASTPSVAAETVALFPVEGTDLPEGTGMVPLELTDELRTHLTAAGLKVVDPALPLADVMVVLGCVDFDGECARGLGKMLGADRIVTGSARGTGGAVRVEIRLWVAASGVLEREVVESLPGAADDLSARLKTVAGKLLGASDPGDDGVDAGKDAPPAELPEESPAGALRPAKPGTKMRPVPIIIGGAGILALAASTFTYLQARKHGVDFDAAPRETLEEIEEILDIRRRGRNFARATVALLAGGGALLAIGGTLLVLDITRGSGDGAAAIADPALTFGFDDGPSVRFRMRFGGALP